jgi:flagellar protein FliO/FliZ
MMRRGLRLAAFLGLAVLLFALPDALTLAAEGGYLSGYTEPDPRPTGVSWWSTLAYLLSLLAVFASRIL